MHPLYTESEFRQAKNIDTLPLKCAYCSKTFYLSKHRIRDALNPKKADKAKLCSRECSHLSRTDKIDCECKQCGKPFSRSKSQYSKVKNHFCSSSCSGTYNSQHKKYGTRVSKLEKWIQAELINRYPNLEFSFNKTDIINAELDICIPSLKLAFELNGIFHYEPIFGKEKLSRTNNNDQRKFQACIENDISLCVIDTTAQKYFKEKTSQKYLDIITNIIDDKITVGEGFEPPHPDFTR